MLENWINGNRKDVVEALIKGKPSDAIEFALLLSKDDRAILLKMLRNENTMLENWINGNRKDVVEALIKGKPSDAIEFALLLSKDDRAILLKMLRNRDK